MIGVRIGPSKIPSKFEIKKASTRKKIAPLSEIRIRNFIWNSIIIIIIIKRRGKRLDWNRKEKKRRDERIKGKMVNPLQFPGQKVDRVRTFAQSL